MAARPWEARRKRPTQRLSPADLRARFEFLLFTWPEQTVRRFGHLAHENLYSLHGPAVDQKLAALEEKNGDGHYTERKRRLDDTIGYLEAHSSADLDKVIGVLERAKEDRFAAYYLGKTRDFRRRYARFQKQRLPALKRMAKELDDLYGGHAKNFYRAHWPDDSDYYPALASKLRDAGNAVEAKRPIPRDAGPLILPDLESVGLIRRFREFLETDPLINHPITGPTVRASAGQPQQKVHHIRRGLKAAGVVDRDVQSALLMAVGLIPFAPERDQ